MSDEDLRVLHVVATDARRGAEVFASDLVGALDDIGIDQRVVVLRGRPVPSIGFRAPVHSSPGGTRIPGIRVDPLALRELRRVTRSFRPSVVQAHGGEALKYALASTSGGSAPPVVYRRIGGAPRWLTKRGLRRAIYARMLRRPAKIVAVADVVRDETIRLFDLPPDRIVTIPNGVDAERLSPGRSREETRRALGIPPTSKVVLAVCALSWEKDPRLLVSVMTQACVDDEDVVCMIAGDGPLRAHLTSWLDAHQARDRIHLLGQRSDMGDIYAASDVLLFGSREDGMEGMPACLIEAGIMGLPVVASAVAGVTELVGTSVAGHAVRAGSEDGLSRGLADVLSELGQWRERAEAVSDRCLETFGIFGIAGRYLDVYRGARQRIVA